MSLAAVTANTALRAEVRLEYVPTPRGALYTWIARPSNSRACVVVCSSLLGDFTANYHRERLLGRALVELGYGVMRFHYAGEGNSWGDRRDITFPSLCDDANAVLNHGVSMGFRKFGLVGTRLGALVAASLAATLPGAPLALWEPVTHPISLIADARRAKRISEAAQGLSAPIGDWREELSERGVLDLLGFDVYAPLVESLQEVSLFNLLGPPPRQLFLARFGGKVGPTAPLRDDLVRAGFSVEYGHYGPSEPWWFLREVALETGRLIPATTAWLTAELMGEP
jgi:pimeloyl-ACP methyl ester carboxylesterase